MKLRAVHFRVLIWLVLILSGCSSTQKSGVPEATQTNISSTVSQPSPIKTDAHSKYVSCTPTKPLSLNNQYYGTYTFENTPPDGSEGWDTSEGQYKEATLSITSQSAHSDKYGLETKTQLRATGGEVYSHTESKVYFSQHAPEGMDNVFTLDLHEECVTGWFRFPKSLDNENCSAVMFVKDSHTPQRNEFSQVFPCLSTWFKAGFLVGDTGGTTDQGFSQNSIRAIGLRVDYIGNSPFEDSYSLDDIKIGDMNP